LQLIPRVPCLEYATTQTEIKNLGEMMQLHELVNTFGQDLQRRYGEKVHKLTLHGGFSCPNRDGTIGRGGCTFCNVASFADEQAQYLPISQQLAQRAAQTDRAKRYLAYFQAYTNTYAEVQLLKNMYEEAYKLQILWVYV